MSASAVVPPLPVEPAVIAGHRTATAALAEARAHAAELAVQAAAIAALEATSDELDDLHRTLLTTARLLLAPATELVWREAHDDERALEERVAQLRRIVVGADEPAAVERAAGVWAALT